MGDELIRKIFRNKNNNQLSLTLPRSKITLLRNGKLPNKVRIKIEGFE